MSTTMQRPEALDLAALQTNMGHRTDYISSSPSGWSVVHRATSAPIGTSAVLVLSAVYPAFALSMVLSPQGTMPRVDPPSVHRSVLGGTGLRPGGYAREEESVGAAVEPEPTAASEMVSLIRSVFALNVSELSRVFGVERATIYGWIKGATPMPREQDKKERLLRAYGLAKDWEAMGGSELGSWKEFPLGDRGSILNMLQSLGEQDPPASDDFAAALQVLRAKQQQSQTVREAALHASIQKHGTNSGDVGHVLDNLDWYLPDQG